MRYPLSSFFLRVHVARRSKAAHIARSSPHQVMGISHAKRFDVDEILYQHCVKKLLGGYLAGYVSFNDPLVRAAVSGEPFSNVRHCVIGASVWPESIRVSTEIGFPDWFQDHPECLLNNAV